MRAPVLKSLAIGCSALGLSLMAHSALATNLVTNGGFNTYSATLATGTQNLVTFSSAGITGWTIGGPNGNGLSYLDNPGTEFTTNYLPVYGPASGSGGLGTDPDGNNAFVEMDGGSSFNATISQTVAGLIAGHYYTLTFDQAAGQQKGFNGGTTEQWQVSLGGSTQVSNLMTDAPGNGTTGDVVTWQQATMTFLATATSEVLSFTSIGTSALGGNQPPIGFLDGIVLQETPEPMSLSLMAVGLLGMGAVRWRRRAKRSATI